MEHFFLTLYLYYGKIMYRESLSLSYRKEVKDEPYFLHNGKKFKRKGHHL